MRAPALALSLALVACGPEFPPVIWSGEHLEYATSLDREICQGTFAVQDRFVAALAELVGLPLDEPVLFVYVDASGIPEFCERASAAGCAREDAVISTKAMNRHELAHAVTLAAGWRGPSPFVEGVAEMFNDGVDVDTTRAPLAEVLDDFQIADDHYYTMGLFVRFLVERRGLDALAAFMRDTEYEATRADYEATFAARFGESLADAMLAFEGYPTCSEWSNRIALIECGLPPAPWADGALDVEVEVECDDPDVIGPVESASKQIAAFVAFEIADEGTYTITATSETEGFSGVRVTRCGSCWDELDVAVIAGEVENVTLPAGRYYATFVATQAAPGPIRLNVERTP